MTKLYFIQLSLVINEIMVNLTFLYIHKLVLYSFIYSVTTPTEAAGQKFSTNLTNKNQGC